MGKVEQFMLFLLHLLMYFDNIKAQALGLQSCEYQENGMTIYVAYVGELFKMTSNQFNLTVTPADATCRLSNNYKHFCLIYSVRTLQIFKQYKTCKI